MVNQPVISLIHSMQVGLTDKCLSKGRVRGKAGKLAVFMNMPLDIIFEVNPSNKSRNYPLTIFRLWNTYDLSIFSAFHALLESFGRFSCASPLPSFGGLHALALPQVFQIVQTGYQNLNMRVSSSIRSVKFVTESIHFDSRLNLGFHKACFRPGIRKTDWKLHVRLCAKCTKQL